jgi:hypothetical protein
MSIASRTIGLAAALVVGVAAISIGTGQAEAKPRQPREVGCVLYGYNGEDVTFYAPGDVEYLQEERYIVRCGNDGRWHIIS